VQGSHADGCIRDGGSCLTRDRIHRLSTISERAPGVAVLSATLGGTEADFGVD